MPRWYFCRFHDLVFLTILIFDLLKWAASDSINLKMADISDVNNFEMTFFFVLVCKRQMFLEEMEWTVTYWWYWSILRMNLLIGIQSRLCFQFDILKVFRFSTSYRAPLGRRYDMITKKIWKKKTLRKYIGNFWETMPNSTKQAVLLKLNWGDVFLQGKMKSDFVCFCSSRDVFIHIDASPSPVRWRVWNWYTRYLR